MSAMQKPAEESRLPSLKWVKTRLRNNPTFRVREKVISGYLIGSSARGTATSDSDLDIAVVIPAKRRVSSLRFTERYHLRMALMGAIYPTFQDRRVDFQFYFPGDTELPSFSKMELK